MRLRKYDPPPPPVIELKQRSANMLVELYHEMIGVDKGNIAFNQNDCSTCVIGNGIRAGILKPTVPNRSWSVYSIGTIDDDDKFGPAIDSIGLPEYSRTHDAKDEYCGAVSDFLFGAASEIVCGGEFLQLHASRTGYAQMSYNGGESFLQIRTGNARKSYTLDAIDACVRIAGVLDRAGYDVSELPSLPRT